MIHDNFAYYLNCTFQLHMMKIAYYSINKLAWKILQHFPLKSVVFLGGIGIL